MRRQGQVLTLVTGPSVLPVVLADMKEHLRVTHSAEDDLIGAYMAAASESIENETGLSLGSQVWEQSFQNPTRDLWLLKTPVQSLTSIKYYDGDNVEQTADLSDFDLFNMGDWFVVRSDEWPATYDRPDAITIRFSCGYASADDMPKTIGQAMKFIVGHWYENRSETSELKLNEIPRAAAHLLSLTRLGWYG